MRRLGVSLPDEIAELMDKVSAERGVKKSQLIAEALKEYIVRHYPEKLRVEGYPTVLWKLKLAGAFALRSPRLCSRRVRGEWVVEEV